jgi:hypothetical protein
MQQLDTTIMESGVFYVPRCYKQDKSRREMLTCVEEGWNTSTVVLRVVGGDENGTQCLGI